MVFLTAKNYLLDPRGLVNSHIVLKIVLVLLRTKRFLRWLDSIFSQTEHVVSKTEQLRDFYWAETTATWQKRKQNVAVLEVT